MNLAEQEIQVSQIVYEEKVKEPIYLANVPLILKMSFMHRFKI